MQWFRKRNSKYAAYHKNQLYSEVLNIENKNKKRKLLFSFLKTKKKKKTNQMNKNFKEKSEKKWMDLKGRKRGEKKTTMLV